MSGQEQIERKADGSKPEDVSKTMIPVRAPRAEGTMDDIDMALAEAEALLSEQKQGTPCARCEGEGVLCNNDHARSQCQKFGYCGNPPGTFTCPDCKGTGTVRKDKGKKGG